MAIHPALLEAPENGDVPHKASTLAEAKAHDGAEVFRAAELRGEDQVAFQQTWKQARRLGRPSSWR